MVNNFNDFILEANTGNINFTSNTFIVNSNYTLISANGSNGSAGEVLTSNGTGNYWAPANAASGGNPTGENTAIQFNNSGLFGGNSGFTFNQVTNNAVLANTLFIGTGTVNSTSYSGTSNDTLFVGTVSSANCLYDTLFVGTVTAANVVSNAQLSGNLANYTNTSLLNSNLALYQTLAGLSGNVAGLTSNNSTNFAGEPQAYYANITDPVFTTGINISANILVNTSTIFIGNSTSNGSINSTYIIFANSTENMNITSSFISTGTSVLGPVQLKLGNSTVNTVINSISFQSGNSTIYSFGNSTTDVWVGLLENASINSTTLLIGNSTVNSTVNSTNFTGISNNSLYLGGVAAASYELTFKFIWKCCNNDC